ncbi:MAG: hypothetical protein V9F04_11130 [Dermatophilaceae bacterium]
MRRWNASGRLCEPVAPPKSTLQYQHYFCAAEHGNAEQLKANEPKRVELYKAVAAVTRAYGEPRQRDEPPPDTPPSEAEAIRKRDRSLRRRARRGQARRWRRRRLQAVRGRHAVPARHLHPGRRLRGRLGLRGHRPHRPDRQARRRARSTSCPTGIKKDPEAVAETITNNMRKVIIDERAMNPKYYDRMSELLDAIIEERRQGALDYQEYLAKLLDAAKKLGNEESDTEYPDVGRQRCASARSSTSSSQTSRPGRRDRHRRPAHQARLMGRQPDEGEDSSQRACAAALPEDFDRLDELFELVKARDEYR